MKGNPAQNLAAVAEKIRKAARKSGRNPENIKLVAVSKMHPIEMIEEAMRAGAVVFGENKIQEAETKIEKISGENVEWHLIGHLQSNKARKSVRLFDVIQTLDSIELAERLERLCIEENRLSLPVFIEVNLAGEASKTGVEEGNLPLLVDYLRSCERLKLAGLMIIPPYFEEAEKARPYFRRLRRIRDEILPDGGLSMGMSHDFEIAIEEGATVVRVGTAIFGEREKVRSL